MFYYLTFLRPPPLQAHPTQPISITPQIANDLRTELYENEVDVFFAWLPAEQPLSLSQTSWTKLTTWREATAYKEIPVSPPKSGREGALFRLALCTKPGRVGPGYCVDFAKHDLGKDEIFPVMSMPILFTSRQPKGSGKSQTGAKQEQTQRLFNVPGPLSISSSSTPPPTSFSITITEKLSFDLDKKLWDSGVGLSHWLAKLASDGARAGGADLYDFLFRGDSPCKIIELGAGTGVVSIALAALMSRALASFNNTGDVEDRGRDVTLLATDLPSAMDTIELNISSNTTLFHPRIRPLARVLDWDDTENLPAEMPADGVDLIAMADVTYNTASFPALLNALRRLSRPLSQRSTSPGPHRSPLVLLAYKERDPAERELFTLTPSINLHFTEIARVPGHGGQPIEIYLGRFDLLLGPDDGGGSNST